MQIKGDAAKLEIITSTGADIDVSISYYTLVDAATTATPKVENTKITAATTTTVLAGVGDTTTQRVGYMQVVNIDASVSNEVTLLLYTDAGASSNATSTRQFKVTLLAGEAMTYNGKSWTHSPANYGVYSPTVLALASDQSNSTATPTEVTGLSVVSVQPGTYVFNYYILYQSGVTTTGIKFDMNFTGTVTSFVWNQMFVGLIATASDANADQDSILAAAAVYNAFSSRAKGTAGRGTTLSVDTAGADMLMRIEGLMIVTVAGDLELWHACETAVAAISTVKAGTSLILHKTG